MGHALAALSSVDRFGLVKFIRTPGDFDAVLFERTLVASRKRFDDHPELLQMADRTIDDLPESFDSYKQQIFLSIPDDYMRRELHKMDPSLDDEKIEAVIRHIQQQRDAHPYFVDSIRGNDLSTEFLQATTGASYEMAKYTAALSGSYIVTDMEVRWRELELDRSEAGIDSAQWSPFAKAFQGLTLSYLNNVPLEAALRLRKEERLGQMRTFMRKVWRAAEPSAVHFCRRGQPFGGARGQGC